MKIKALIPTQYSLPDNKRNMNAYQRVYYGSRYADITLIMRRNQVVSREIAERVRVCKAPVENRWLFLLYSLLVGVLFRFRGVRVLLTEPSGFAAVGFLAKYLAGYFWALDVWDRPRWRTGSHEKGIKPPWSDRLVFWLMRHADLYLLSVMPRAAQDIDPEPGKCLQLYNAIDLANMAAAPPRRTSADPTLHLAYGRSEFQETMGIDVLIKAAEILQDNKCPIKIHLIGEISPESMKRIRASRAADSFQAHGFTKESRTEFFRRIHVGLVPYLAYEDLSYIFPIKVLEHLSQGNPVIASRIPGLMATIQDEYNGLLVEPGNPDDLAQAIERLQRDPVLWEKLSNNALKSITKFEAGEKNRKIFLEILGRTNHGTYQY